MTDNLYIIWPLDEPPPAWEDAVQIYSRLNTNVESKTMARWFTECLIGAHWRLVGNMELGPYGFAHWYELIEENGFPDGPDDWVSPDEMIEAPIRLRSFLGTEDPETLTLVECFIMHNRARQAPMPPPGQPIPRVLEGEDPFDVGAWRINALSILLQNLEGVILTAHHCRIEGIERVAFCYSC